jgi:glycosyltransferase involved in cell wall biosynthesis
MKILLAAPTYLPSRRANTIQVMKMAQATTEVGHHVRVLVPDLGQGKVLAWEPIASHYGLRHRFDIDWLAVSPRLRGYDYGVKVVRYFRQWGADLLYTRFPQAGALASMLGIPTILEVHDLPRGIMGRYLFRRFLQGRGAHQLVLITQSLQEAISRAFAPLPDTLTTQVVPDGVDLDRYDNLPPPYEARQHLKAKNQPGVSVSRFTIGYTGHLYPGRGVDLILEMASRLPDMSFLVVGGDPQAVEAYRTLIANRKLDNVLLTGFVSNMDLPDYQAACDILLMPYQNRVAASSGGDIGRFLSPMKLFEYLASGRVILSSYLPVLCEVLNNENAILLPPDELDAWVAAILEISLDAVRREKLAKKALQDARLYTWETRAKRIFSFED